MNDAVLRGFLEAQLEEGLALAARSDILELELIGPRPVQGYIARFRAKGLVLRNDEVVETDRLDVGIRLGSDYLRHAEPAHVLTILAPCNAFHPNIRGPFVCIGALRPGTALTDLLHRTYELWTYQAFTTVEVDSMNAAACGFARANGHRFPIDRRPLCRPRPAQEASR